MKEYDIVELIGMKPEYKKSGLKIGDVGVIMDPRSIDNTRYVIFSEYYTGEDFTNEAILEEDLRVLEFDPDQKFQPNDKVELTNWRSEYEQYGVKLGDIGIVYDDKLISTTVYVKFDNCESAVIYKEDLEIGNVHN